MNTNLSIELVDFLADDHELILLMILQIKLLYDFTNKNLN